MKTLNDLRKIIKAEERCCEIYSVISDIMCEAEKGKICWVEALEQIKNELKEAGNNEKM